MTQDTSAVPSAVLRPMATLRAPEMAARRIADLVLRRTIAEGDRLPSECDMADRLGVSRSTVREALRLLESWGLVRVERGRGKGPVVRYPGIGDMTRSMAMLLDTHGITLAEVTEGRIAIEGACMRLAAARYDEGALRALLDSVDRVQPGTPEWEDHTVSFHTALARATSNVVLEAVVGSLGGPIRYSASLAPLSPESQGRTLRAHRRIAQALLARNRGRAERRLLRHMRAFLALMRTRYAVDVGSLTAGLIGRAVGGAAAPRPGLGEP